MAQENMDDFMQLAKDYAAAEKKLGVQHWVYISIERKDKDGNCSVLFHYDLPREVYERREWVIEWRKAKFVCLYPKDQLNCYYSFYDKRLGNNPKLTDDLRKLVSAKVQVTKIERKIKNYIASNSGNMFFCENTDSDLSEAREKLAIRKADVQAAEERLYMKIKELQVS